MQKLGQHFLTSRAIARKIVAVADLGKDDLVLEVGPGRGMLTQELLKTGARVIVVEKDKKLAELLADKFKDKKNLEIVHADIRNFLKTKKLTSYKVVANIPYYLTSHLIKLLLADHVDPPKKIVLMVQKEVAERIIATPPHMNLLALSVQVYAKPKIAFKVPRSFFKPRPKVDSAVIVIENISKEFFADFADQRDPQKAEEEFFALLRRGFSSKRKMLINNLSDVARPTKEEWEQVIKKCKIPAKARAENLSLDDWGCVYKKIN